MNNIVEQGHRTVKKRTWPAKGYGSFATAWRTLQGIEVVHMIRKGRVRWVPKEDAMAQTSFIGELFGIAAQLEVPIQRFLCQAFVTSQFRDETSRSNRKGPPL